MSNSRYGPRCRRCSDKELVATMTWQWMELNELDEVDLNCTEYRSFLEEFVGLFYRDQNFNLGDKLTYISQRSFLPQFDEWGIPHNGTLPLRAQASTSCA